jgi:maltose O-acetyltransferase
MPTAKERMRAGELYPGDDPQVNRELDARQVLVAAANEVPNHLREERHAAMVGLLAEVGEGVLVRAPFYCDWGDGIRIVAGTFVNFNCVMLDGAPITIGAGCQLAPGVQLITATHPLDPAARLDLWEQALPVTLGDGVWLGAGVIVCPGVTIGENTTVGAGAIVTRDLPANVVAYGNPARVAREVGERDRFDPPESG